MKYEIKKLLAESKVEISVVFTKEEYDAKYETVLAIEMANAEMKGFRKGKVPRNMYLKNYGDTKVNNGTVNELTNESYEQIATQEKLALVGMPSIDLLTDIEDTEWGYKAVVSVYPSLEPKDYFGVEVQKEKVEITEESLQKELQRNLNNHADLEIIENGVLENNNTAIFDFCGYVNGEKFPGGEAENYELEIGSGKFIPGFEEQMLGMKVEEEKTLKVKFPEQYTEELAGKDAEFVVKLHEIKKRVSPELNDDFVKGLELENINTVSEYREYLKNNLTLEATEASANKFVDEVFEKVLNNNPVFIPEEMIEDGIDKKMSQLEEMAKSYQMPVELLLKYQGIESVEQYRELLKPGIKSSIHYEIVVAAISNAENVQLTDEDYEKYYLKLAKDKDIEVVKAQYSKENVTEYFKMLKTHDLIIESVKQD